jgi:hypothetical protein
MIIQKSKIKISGRLHANQAEGSAARRRLPYSVVPVKSDSWQQSAASRRCAHTRLGVGGVSRSRGPALYVGSPIRKLASITDPLGRNGHDETLASWLPIEGENGWLSIS